MKKAILFILVFMCTMSLGHAGHPWAKRTVVAEVGIGTIYTRETMFFTYVEPGMGAFAEMRYNFSRYPLDVGLRIQGDMFGRSEGQLLDSVGYGSEYMSARILGIADYNFVLNRTVKLFVGGGAGLGYVDITEKYERIQGATYTDPGEHTVLTLQPRFGIELFARLRITMSYTHGDSANSYHGLHVGYVF